MAASFVVYFLFALANTFVSGQFSDKCPDTTSTCEDVVTGFLDGPSNGVKCVVSVNSDVVCKAYLSDVENCFPSPIYQDGFCRSTPVEEDVECWTQVVSRVYEFENLVADCGEDAFVCVAANAFCGAEARSLGCFMVQSLLEITSELETVTYDCQVALLEVVDAIATGAKDAADAFCANENASGVEFELSFDSSVSEKIETALKTCWNYCTYEPEPLIEVIIGPDGGD